MITTYHREAVFADIPALVNIELACFSSDLISRRQMHYLIKKAKRIFLVVCHAENHDILGYALCLTPRVRKTARLYSIAVLPQFRGFHIGTTLLEALCQTLKAEGYGACVLEVRASDTKTQAMYQRIGFIMSRQVPYYYEDGEDALRMRLNLGV
ncbi:MAG: N-acetyltransferase [Legionellaceae bacterium]|nr:N-acetyltransferase [Legionellaceae bacterium]